MLLGINLPGRGVDAGKPVEHPEQQDDQGDHEREALNWRHWANSLTVIVTAEHGDQVRGAPSRMPAPHQLHLVVRRPRDRQVARHLGQAWL
jgi:hypothetical protein